MKVTTKISFNPDVTNGVTTNSWGSQLEVFNMHVPERILVGGQNQYIGTRSPPREILYDNSILPKDPYPGYMLLGTPPRTLTLDKYQFPSVNERPTVPEKKVHPHLKSKTQVLSELCNEGLIVNRRSTPHLNTTGENLAASEEILHLRPQMAKLNQRVMVLELENMSRLQKEKIRYVIGIAYFLLKSLIWLSRSY